MATYTLVNWLSRFGLLCFALSGLVACRHSESVASAQPVQIPVKLASVQSGTIADSTEYVANLESRQSVTLQPRVEGQVSQILVKPGEEVTAGTLLMQIDPARQQASVSSYAAAAAGSQADLANAKATLKNYQAERQERLANLKLNQVQYERYTTLQSQGAVSRQTLDEYTNRLEVAKAGIAK